MGEKQCSKCGEMADEAKAFCPGCGNAFVEEKSRTTVSEFDQSEHTVRLGNTMYNQMLSDMGLSISKAPNRGEKRAEMIEPVAPATGASSPERKAEPPAVPVDGKRKILIWIGVIVIAFAILAAIVIVAAVAVLLYLR